jgi:hypothetical protein
VNDATEVLYTLAPQPYGELFVMRYDGTHVERLTDNQWEDAGPAWQPRKRYGKRGNRDSCSYGLQRTVGSGEVCCRSSGGQAPMAITGLFTLLTAD